LAGKIPVLAGLTAGGGAIRMRGLSYAEPNQMYAVIATGGKQYRVEKDSLLKVEKLDAEPGATVSFDNVLLVADGSNIKVGAPLVAGAKVSATVESHGQGEKKVIVKFRRRKHYKRAGNHRQQYTLVKITAIA
jgi:large subunit ribosomal protein L21